MKRIITSILAICLLALTALGAVSCGRPPKYAEIEARFIELVEASYEINKIIFGEGLPTDARIYDPWQNMKTYERKDENGNVLTNASGKPLYGYYSFFTDEVYGDMLVYRDGATAPTVYLEVDEGLRFGEKRVYLSEQSGLSFYESDYAPPENIRYYSESDPDNYDYVAQSSAYQSIEQIKMAAEQIYSLDYLNDSVYEWLFTGVVSADEKSNLEGLSARYIEYSNSDEGTAVTLMKSNTYGAIVTETRKFDFSTAKVVKPGSKKLVNIEVETYLESAPEQRVTVKVTMVKVDGVWYLDSGTY